MACITPRGTYQKCILLLCSLCCMTPGLVSASCLFHKVFGHVAPASYVTETHIVTDCAIGCETLCLENSGRCQAANVVIHRSGQCECHFVSLVVHTEDEYLLVPQKATKYIALLSATPSLDTTTQDLMTQPDLTTIHVGSTTTQADPTTPMSVSNLLQSVAGISCSASSRVSSSMGCEKALDSLESTSWASNQEGINAWMVITLPTTYILNAIHLYSRCNDIRNVNGAARATFSDGSFEDVTLSCVSSISTCSDVPGVLHSLTPTVATSAVRLDVTAVCYGGHYNGFREVVLMGIV